MSNLKNRAMDINAHIVTSQQKALSQNLKDNLASVTQTAKNNLELLNGCETAVALLIDKNLKLPQRSKSVRESTAKSIKLLRTVARSIERPDQEERDLLSAVNSTNLKNGLDSAGELAKSFIDSIQKVFNAQRLKLLPEDIGEPVPEIPNQTPRILRLRRAQERLQNPIKVETEDLKGGIEPLIEKYQELVNDAAFWMSDFPEVKKALKSETPEMRKFLLEASTEDGASLELLTPDVLQQLQNGERLSYYRIKYS